jgi:hypothetical protein
VQKTESTRAPPLLRHCQRPLTRARISTRYVLLLIEWTTPARASRNGAKASVPLTPSTWADGLSLTTRTRFSMRRLKQHGTATWLVRRQGCPCSRQPRRECHTVDKRTQLSLTFSLHHRIHLYTMNEPPDPPGSGHPLSSGSGHPLSSGLGRPSQTGRGRLVPSHDDGRHQLDQHRLRELYPVIPTIIYNEQTSRSSRLRSPSFSPVPYHGSSQRHQLGK